MWQQWVNFILGLIIMAMPFLGLSAAAMMWALVASGLIIAALGLWGAQETTVEREQGRMVHRPQH